MKKHISFYLAFVALIMTATPAGAQHFNPKGYTFKGPEERWIDSLMAQMTVEQKVAQLMMVRVPLNMTDQQTAEFSQRMNGYGVGGVCFFVGTAERQVPQTRQLQSDARIPLLVAIDAEWGLGMRLKDCFSFPKNARFGRLSADADTLVRRMGEEIGRQCREMGIHINFAPVVDINSNPKNPVIGTRSFGTDRERVSQLGIQYMLGLQSQGVLATAKHFPGHGDTDADSHYELPVINHTTEYIDSVDTYPFRRLIEAGVGGVMTAHLQVNALDSQHPSSLSRKVVTGLLREQMGFDGLIVTDGLDMKGVTNTYKDGMGELAAMMAGNDILLLPPDVPKAIATISQAARKTDSVMAAVDYHCRRVLQYKYRQVKPHMADSIHVPSPEHWAVCEQIVRDLNLTTDRRIDSLAQAAIAAHATPGCQVVALHRGRVVVDRCYGRQTYDPQSPAVTPQTVYDVASLTKVCATTLAVMKLVDEGKVKLSDSLGQYLPYLDSTDKRGLTLIDVMTHQARLRPFDAYWQQSQVRDTILSLVANSRLNDKVEYLYSDLGFMLLGDVVERVAGMPLEQYVEEQFYRPMGLGSTMFLPTNGDRIALSRIAPTEQDTLRGLIHGVVHDPNAAAMGGVSGHAGLFSTARDLASLMQMLLDGGVYNGRRYLSQQVIGTFTARPFAQRNNRRAIGFDKPTLSPSKGSPCCAEASQQSYGHTGFTGTMVWVDPEAELVYVFLSNRVHPTSTPNLLAQMNVRTDIQSALYDILLIGSKNTAVSSMGAN